MYTAEELTSAHLVDPYDCPEEATCSDKLNYSPGN